MVRRMTPAQYNAWVRQYNARRKRAIDHYNAEVRRVNAHNERVVRDHNRRARAHNERLRREIAKLNSKPSVRHSSYRTSVVTLTETFSRLEAAVQSDRWTGSDELFDLSESETANSVGALNSLLEERTDNPASEAEIVVLRATTITTELSRCEADLDARWRGALFSLHPDNPDASRHFCTRGRIHRVENSLAPVLCTRDLSHQEMNQGQYMALCDHRGVLINDPIAVKIDDDCYWLSIDNSDIWFWAFWVRDLKYSGSATPRSTESRSRSPAQAGRNKAASNSAFSIRRWATSSGRSPKKQASRSVSTLATRTPSKVSTHDRS